MLRREGEAVLVGEMIEIRILEVVGSRVKMGISAPRTLRVQAREKRSSRVEIIAPAEVRASAWVMMVPESSVTARNE